MLRTVFEESLEGNRPRGRKRIMMLEDIKYGKIYDKFKEKAIVKRGMEKI